MVRWGVWKKTFKAIAVMPGVDATAIKLGASELGEWTFCPSHCVASAQNSAQDRGLFADRRVLARVCG